MSLLWTDRILVSFHPDRIALMRIRRGWRPSVAARAIIPCRPDPGCRWLAAATALEAALQQDEWRHARIDMVLSQHFVRFATVPAGMHRLGKAEREAYARHCLSQASGELDGEWRICLSDVPPGLPALACAVEAELLGTLDRITAAAQSRLSSVRPFPVAAFDARRWSLSSQKAWFAAIESDRCCLFHIEQGIVLHVDSRRIFSSVESELRLFLKQEQLLSHFVTLPTEVFLVAPEHRELSLSGAAPFNVTVLPTRQPKGVALTDSAYAMAWEAAT